MRKIKKIVFSILITLMIILIIYLVFEIISRILMGQRLVVKVEENGLYHFLPNQKGWYGGPEVGLPDARINNIEARGEDIDMLNKTKKYIFFGDSFTFGWVLEDNETISYYFMKEKNLTPNNVINYGNGGYGPEHMFAAYNFYKNLFSENDTIIMILIEHDFYRLMMPYKKSLIKEIFWKIKGKSSSIAWIWANYRYVVAKIKGKEEKEVGKGITEGNKTKLLNFRDQIEKDDRNIIYVFYEYKRTNYSIQAKEFCEKNNLLCITNVYDYIEIVEEKGKDIYSVDKGHPSPDSNHELAKGIISFINQKEI